MFAPTPVLPAAVQPESAGGDTRAAVTAVAKTGMMRVGVSPRLTGDCPQWPSVRANHQRPNSKLRCSMANTVFVHIGLYKTGSTAIQKFLTDNAAHLRRDGLIYPRTFRDRIAHHSIPRLLQKGAHIPWDDLQNELAATDKAIISSEDFGAVGSPNAWKHLRDNLPGTVKILCYLRRQDEMLESMYNQHLKMGGTKSLDDFKRDVLCQLDYRVRLQRLTDVFGAENIIVRPYNKGKTPSALFADFLSAIELDMKPTYVCPARAVNPSLNDTGITFMRFIKEHFPNRIALWCARQVANRFLYLRPSQSPHLRFSLDERNELLSRFAESNTEVARRYLGQTELFRVNASPQCESGCAGQTTVAGSL